jgi:hypothetical protein
MPQLISITRRNWLVLTTSLLSMLLINSFSFSVLAITLFSRHLVWLDILGTLVFSGVVLLTYEFFLNGLVEITITKDLIVFRKPLKTYSLLFRKKRNTWTIDAADWNELIVMKFKSIYHLYFRLEKSATLFATVEYGSKFVSDIKEMYPSKRINDQNNYSFPSHLRKQLKKEHPERVMRG